MLLQQLLLLPLALLHYTLLLLIYGLLLLHFNALCSAGQGTSSGTSDGSEEWGYVEVRGGAHMFWWLYKSPVQSSSDWPLILWLQGGLLKFLVLLVWLLETLKRLAH
ncbi:hypothetical protein KP509_28G032500 [Ceratopteris richardii]|uniref:Uncharacterized protein n=1 Tax=Ceratopteris richardii TaxID=49495 RepID=A0A8T2RDL3_CERRI|nr:hypothetical protein KP509_28G032500 [Ceratopteris richardii]